MTGAIIVITVFYYLFSIGLDKGLTAAGLSLPWVALFLPPLLAGYLGGVQFVRTEVKPLRIIGQLTCAIKSSLAIVFTPIAITFVLIAVGSLSAGLGMMLALPDIAAFLTAAALMGALFFLAYGFPLIFIGFSFGHWRKQRRMKRRNQGYSAAANRRP